MGKHTRKGGCPHDGRAGTLGELIHEAVRRNIELAVEEELTAALGAARYARDAVRGGYRNGRRARTVTGPTGPLALTLPRATLFAASGTREWMSTLVPRYQRRLREVNEAVVATYLAGGNTRRLRGALAPLLKAAPLSPAEAQPAGRVFRIGVLGGSRPTTPEAARGSEALVQGLRELGYVEGQNLVIEWRWAEGRAERYHELAAELVALKPDVIVAPTTPGVSAAKRATSTIPIVMAGAGDPVGTGLVASLARPGANITGVSGQNDEVAGKRLDLLKQAFPGVSRVGLLLNTTLPHRDFIWRDLQSAAVAIGVTLQLFEVRGPEDFERGLTSKASESFQALIVHPDSLAFQYRREIAEFGVKKRIPVMAGYGFAEAGCLMSYDAHWPDLTRRAASYVDKILKGAKPADLPVAQPTKFSLIVNLKTAKALGLTIPQSVLLRADQVIE